MEKTLMESMGNRVNIQSLKLEVHTTQILERVMIRKQQLESLLNEELEASTRLTQLQNGQTHMAGSLGLESSLLQRLAEIERQRRDSDQQCWRDVGMVIPHLLSALEALQASKAREDILSKPNSNPIHINSKKSGMNPEQILKPHYTFDMNRGNYRA